jgi:hypothetical protein
MASRRTARPRQRRWPFSEPTLRTDPGSSPGVFPTATSRSRTAGCALHPQTGSLAPARAHSPLSMGGAARGRGRHASRWRRCRADLGSRMRTGAGSTLAGSLKPGRGRSRPRLGRDRWAVPDACPAERAALHTSGELASTEARRLLTADGALDRVGPDSRLPTEGLGMSGSAATLARPGGRRGVGGRAWAAGGAGAGPGERHRAYKLDQHRDRRRWRSETLLSDVCTRQRSRRRTKRSEG